ncbi:MAG: PEGA domain-containing protein [Pseudomonadales bacterium]
MNTPRDNGVRITATGYQPYVAERTRRGVRRWQIVVGVVLLVVAGLLAFLFTARSVALDFSAPADDVSVHGGLSFELGGVWLLLPGDYTIEAHADGYKPLNAAITVGPERNQRHSLTFIPLPGIVTITSEPAGASVFIDSEAVGATPLEAIDVESGSREVVLRLARYETQAQVLDVTGHRTKQELAVTLLPDWGDVTVSSDPSGARVLIDGNDSGIVTPGVVPVPSGEREIAVTLDGYRTARQRIVVAARQADTLPPFQLVQADAALRITSSPAGAGITVNGKYMGQTPLDLELSSGVSYRLEAYLRGHRKAAVTAVLARGESRPISFPLVREMGNVRIVVEPATARVTVNGRAVDIAAGPLSLPTEPQNIAISLDGYAGYTTTVTPRAGLTQSVKVRLLTVQEARLAQLKPEYANSAGQHMVLFKPSHVQLGASRREPGRRANEAIREIDLKRLFYVGKYETTNAQFRQFASGHDSGEFENNTLNKDLQPVVNVTWIDAARFCNWLSDNENLPRFYREQAGAITGINPDATGYRLPTEAEWAWLARHVADDKPQLRFPWGDAMPPPDRQGNYADRAASHIVAREIFQYNDNFVVTAPVGSFKPNHKGLYDIGGNVAEWINDWYAAGDQAGTDPLGPASGKFHVISGSSWMQGTVTDLRLAYRDYGTDARPDLGFRVARFAE